MKNYLPLLTLLLAIGCSQPQEQPKEATAEAEPLNFVVIYTDELEMNDVGCYGGKFPTPNIDRLAQEGVQFMQAHTTASMCTPSRFSAMTGMLAGRCRFPGFLEVYPDSVPYSIAWNTWIDENTPTLARLLKKEGYFTGMAGKWHIGELPTEVRTSLPAFQADDDPNEDAVQEKLQQHQATVAGYLKQSAGFDVANSVLWGNFDGFPVRALANHNIPWITKGGIEFLQAAQQQEKPFFLYITPTAIHGPNHFQNLKVDLRHTIAGYQPEVMKYAPDSASLLEQAKVYTQAEAHRFAGIADIDHQVGLLIGQLEQAGIYDRTAIIFMADHNIEPGKATCYEKGTHVPMIVRWPGMAAGMRNETTLVQNTDILPTLLHAAGAQELPQPLDGSSLLPVLEGKTDKIREFTYSEAGYTRSISDGRYKYIALRFPEEVMQQIENGGLLAAPNHLNTPKQAHSRIAIEHFPHYFAPEQLYDLQADPYEQQNLANDAALQEQLQRLKTALGEHLKTIPHPFPLQDDRLNSAAYQQLAVKARETNTVEDIVWWKRDHGDMVWPPANPEGATVPQQ